jgi:hypothetical protein
VDKFGDPIAVPERDVREAIMATTNKRDKWTVVGWLKMLINKGLFREAAGNRIIIQDGYSAVINKAGKDEWILDLFYNSSYLIMSAALFSQNRVFAKGHPKIIVQKKEQLGIDQIRSDQIIFFVLYRDLQILIRQQLFRAAHHLERINICFK